MLEHPQISLRAVAVALLLLSSYAGMVVAIGRWRGIRQRPDEALAIGACLVVVTGSVIALLARGLTTLDARTGVGPGAPSLDAAVACVVLLPLVGVGLLWRRAGLAGHVSLRRAAPVAALAVAATVVVGAMGANVAFRTDSDQRAQAVKEMVWADGIALASGTPNVPPENLKYVGYLTSRAMVTDLAGTDPWAPSVAWIAIAAAGLAAGLLALIRNLGLPAWTAAFGLAALPLLGGDSYRLSSIGDARSIAAMLLLVGLALVSRGLTERGSRLWLAGLGGALAGASSLVHMQFFVIAGSVLLPALAIALVLGPRYEWPVAPLAVACLVAVGLSGVGLAQGASLVGSSSLADTAAERTEGETVTGKALLTSQQAVWPPQSVTLNGVRLLYRSPSLYMLHPSALVKHVWGERTNLLLALTGLLAAWSLRRRVSPLLVMVLAGTALVPVAVLFNPLVFPFYDRYFSSYRAEYIGFELPFLGIAAVAAAVAVHRRRAVVLAVLAGIAALPVVRATVQWQQGAARNHAGVREHAGLRSFRDLQRWVRYSDVVVASPAAVALANGLGNRSNLRDGHVLRGGPFNAGAAPDTVLRTLADLPGRRVVVVVDESTPARAPIRRLIAQGRVPSAVGGDGAPGVYWLRVTLF